MTLWNSPFFDKQRRFGTLKLSELACYLD